MRREKIEKICRDLEASLSPSQNVVRDAIDVQKQVAITLYWLASSAEFRTIANLFDVGKTSVCTCVHKACTVIVETFSKSTSVFPLVRI